MTKKGEERMGSWGVFFSVMAVEGGGGYVAGGRVVAIFFYYFFPGKVEYIKTYPDIFETFFFWSHVGVPVDFF